MKSNAYHVRIHFVIPIHMIMKWSYTRSCTEIGPQPVAEPNPHNWISGLFTCQLPTGWHLWHI